MSLGELPGLSPDSRFAPDPRPTMTATYTWDVFCSQDGFGSVKRRQLAASTAGAANGLRGQHVPGICADAGLEH
jgi:hypothetical protein